MSEELRRLAWQCRRGMLELDELLGAFLEQEYPALDEGLKEVFRQLLQEGDTDLFTWLFEAPGQAPEHYAPLVARIRGSMRITPSPRPSPARGRGRL